MAKTIKLNAPKTQEYSLKNLSSLVDADIAIIMRDVETNGEYPELYLELPEEDKEKYGKYLLNLLGALRNVKELTLYEGILEVASGALDLCTQLPQFCNLRCLGLYFWLSRGCLRSIVYLLTTCPNIESLDLCKSSFRHYPLPPQLGIPDEDDDRNVGVDHRFSISVKVGSDWKAGLPLSCMLLHLKHVSIVGIEGQDNELEYLEFLLKNAVVLEELDMLSYLKDVSPDRKRQMNSYYEKLKTLPRASSSLSIKFENLCPTIEGREILTWPNSDVPVITLSSGKGMPNLTKGSEREKLAILKAIEVGY
ncbi:hypothetical protein MKX03_003667 [Papaver bracteatum]|nr:hypothetical protein MKX03_003667 [Papaver bracteatum]